MKKQQKSGYEKYAIIFTAVAVVYAAVIGTLNFLQTPKIGYVDSSVLMEKYPTAIEAREKFDARMSEWNQNIKTLESEINKLNQEMVADAGKWKKNTLKEKKETLQKKQQDYVRYSRAIQEKAAKLEQELMQPVYAEINAYMKDFGDDAGYEMIFGTLAGGNILFAQDAVDLTKDFLAYAKAKM